MKSVKVLTLRNSKYQVHGYPDNKVTARLLKRIQKENPDLLHKARFVVTQQDAETVEFMEIKERQ